MTSQVFTDRMGPSFFQFISESGLPFHANEQFGKADLDERYEFYRRLAGMVWNPESLLGGLS